MVTFRRTRITDFTPLVTIPRIRNNQYSYHEFCLRFSPQNFLEEEKEEENDENDENEVEEENMDEFFRFLEDIY